MRARAGEPSALLGALVAAVLPTPDETSLARACLATGDAGRQAWAVCQERFGDLIRVFREDSRGLKRWAPLLQDALRRHEVVPPPALATVLRAAAFQEELRTREYQRIVREVLSRLQAAEVPVLVLKGPALAERVYPRPALRHSHDLELLVRQPHDLDRVVNLLVPLGARPMPPTWPAPADAVLLQHATGLPIGLCTRLFRTPHYHIPTEALWARRSAATLAGVPAQALAPDDTLLHILGHAASSPARASLQWVADAWFLLHRHPDLDWGRLVRTAREGRLGLTLAAMLPYLAGELGASIPGEVLTRVRRAGEAAPRIERDALLAGVRAPGDGGLRRLFRAASPRERLGLLFWLLGPSPEYLRQVYGPRLAALLPLLYAYRPIAYAARLLGRGRFRPLRRS